MTEVAIDRPREPAPTVPLGSGAGPSVPAWAAEADTLDIRSARPGVRTWAFVIDLVIWGLFAGVGTAGAVVFALGSLPVLGVILSAAGFGCAALFGLLQLITHGRRGVTAGKAAMRLRSVSVSTDESRRFGRPGFWRIVGRAAVLCAAGVIPIVGPLLLLISGVWDARGRSVLDRVGGCWLIDTRAGLDPVDERALRRARRALDDPFAGVAERLPSLATLGSAESRPPIDGFRSASAVVGAGRRPWADAEGFGYVSAATAHTWLVFEDGSRVVVPQIGLIGRMPEARPGENVDALVALEDPRRMLSKTHAAFGVDVEGVWVEDRGSSNGTVIAGVGGTTTTLEPGRPVYIDEADVVQVGGRAFRILREMTAS